MTVSASTTYLFKYVVPFSSSATATGIGLSVAGPAGTYTYRVSIQQAAAGTDSFYEFAQNAQDTAIVSASVVAINTRYYAEVEGVVSVGVSGGTLQLRARAETAANITILTNTSGYLIQMP
jgi:hypothetical protein